MICGSEGSLCDVVAEWLKRPYQIHLEKSGRWFWALTGISICSAIPNTKTCTKDCTKPAFSHHLQSWGLVCSDLGDVVLLAVRILSAYTEFFQHGESWSQNNAWKHFGKVVQGLMIGLFFCTHRHGLSCSLQAHMCHAGFSPMVRVSSPQQWTPVGPHLP